MVGLRQLPGHLLRRPVSLVAVALLLVNDNLLKRVMPGTLTGKLSDIAGLVLLPLALVSLAEAARYVFHRQPWRTTVAEVQVTTAVTAVGFTAVKLSTRVAEAFEHALSAVRWTPSAAASLLTHHAVPAFKAVVITHDATDLLALPVLVAVLLVAQVPTTT